jgi:hypothetical protein
MKRKNKLISAILFYLIAVLFIAFVFVPSMKKINTDFPNYYVSSNMLLDGKDMKTAYDNVEFNRQLLLYGIEGQIVSFIPYPPVSAILFLPIAKLEPLTAKLVWNIFNVILLIFCIYVLWKLTNFDFYNIGIIFFLSAYALTNNFLFGQAYLLVLLCLCLSIYFMIQGKDLLAALFMALSIVLKFYTVYFIFLFIFKKRFKLLFYTIAFGLMLYIPVVLITGYDVNLFYYSKLIFRLSDGWVGTAYAVEYQSFITLLHKLFNYEPVLNPHPLINSLVMFYIFKYLFVCGVLSVSLSYLIKTNENIKLEISLFCIISMLFLPLNASYQYVVLIPAIVFLCEYYLKDKDYIMIGTLLFILLFINSPAEVWVVNKVKDSSFFLLGYTKLFALLYLWLLNLKILGVKTGVKPFGSHTRKYMLIGGIHVVGLTIMSSLINIPINDGAHNVVANNNYMISMPSALNTMPERFIYTECTNGKFTLNSNFGFKYDKENVFNPIFIDSSDIAYETIVDKKAVKRLLNLNNGESTVTDKIYPNHTTLSKNENMKCYITDGQLFLEDIKNSKVIQLTSGRQLNSHPVFANNDTKIIFCSDRNRGTGFTTLYEFDINRILAGK